MSTPTQAQAALAAQLRYLAQTVEQPLPPTARDWFGFFAGLAAFIAAIMPFIIPLFSVDDEP